MIMSYVIVHVLVQLQRWEKRHKPRAAFALLLLPFGPACLAGRTNVRSNCCFILRNCLSGYNIGRVITRTSLSFVNTKMSYCLGTQISWQMRYILSWLGKWKKMMETSDQRLDKNAPHIYIDLPTRGYRLCCTVVKLGLMLLGRCW